MQKRIALIAHDNMKKDLIEWCKFNIEKLKKHKLFATHGTGLLLEQLGLQVTKLKPGPLGGDQEVGSLIATGNIDFLIFFWDPLEPHPHDPDVKALLRLAVVWNVPCACNRATADFLISSELFESDYKRKVPDYSKYM